MTVDACFYGCGKTRATADMRPYGPGGAWVCFPCATATPERNASAEAAYGALLEAAEAGTGVAAIGLDDGGPVAVVDPELLAIVDRALGEVDRRG